MKFRDDVADAHLARTSGVRAYLPWILRYPLSGHALPVVIMISLFIVLAMKSSAILPMGIPDMGLPLLVITLIWSLFYLLRVMEHSALGHATPPPMDGEVVYLNAGKTLSGLFLPLLVAMAVWSLRGDSRAITLVLALAAYVMPAYLLILAVDKSLLSALNPLRQVQVIAALGAPYLWACLALSASVALLWMLAGALWQILFVALTCYLLFAVAHLLGFLAYHRHARLGLDVAVRDPDLVAREQEQKDRLERLLVRVENCLQVQDKPGAAREILSEPGGPVSVRQFCEDLWQRILTIGHPLLIHSAGRKLISVLLAENRDERALDIAEVCLNKHSGFEPDSTLQLERLARQALKAKYYELFGRLLRDIEARYPGDPITVTAQFLQAQYHAEHRNDDVRARELLAPLLAQKNHSLHPRIAAYARALDNLAQKP